MRSANYVEIEKVRYYECQSQGHYGRDCPNKGKGIKCYNCNGYGTHRASECPYPPRQSNNGRGGGSRGNARYTNLNNTRGFSKNGHGRGYKRKSEQNGSDNTKRGRYRGRGRGGKYNRKPTQENNSAEQPKRKPDQPTEKNADKGKNETNLLLIANDEKNAPMLLDQCIPQAPEVINANIADVNETKFPTKFLADSGAKEHITHSKIIFRSDRVYYTFKDHF